MEPVATAARVRFLPHGYSDVSRTLLTSAVDHAMAYRQVPNCPSALTAATQRPAAAALTSASGSKPFVSRVR
jgi:hypothetical protein